MYRGIFVVMDHPICRCRSEPTVQIVRPTANLMKIRLYCPRCKAEHTVPMGDLQVRFVEPDPVEMDEPGSRIELLLGDAEKS